MSGIFKAHFLCDCGHWLICLTQQLHRLVDAQILYILPDAHPLQLGEEVGKVVFIQMAIIGNVFKQYIFVIVFFYIYAFNPNFVDRYNIVSMAQSLAPYAIMSLGVTFVIATGGIDLSIGTVCIAAAVIAGKMHTLGMIPLWATIPVMLGIGLVVGFVNGLLITKLKMPMFIATLGTMMFSRGLAALIVVDPNIFFPTGTWYSKLFSNANGIPTGIIWVLGFMLLCMYLMYKNKAGRYILAIGSNEEATRLSGINTDRYKILAYTISGLGAGLAAVFWSAALLLSTALVAKGESHAFWQQAMQTMHIRQLWKLFSKRMQKQSLCLMKVL